MSGVSLQWQAEKVVVHTQHIESEVSVISSFVSLTYFLYAAIFYFYFYFMEVYSHTFIFLYEQLCKMRRIMKDINMCVYNDLDGENGSPYI